MSKETVQRIGIAAILVPIAMVTAYLGGWYFAFLVALMCAATIYEIQQMLMKLEWKGTPVIGVVFGFVTPLLVHYLGAGVLVPLYLTLVLALGIVAIFRGVSEGFYSLSTTFFSTVLIGLPMASMILIRDGGNWPGDKVGGLVIIYLWGGAWISDTFAYLIGRKFGKRKLASELSPKKTIAGSVATFVSAMLWCVLGAEFIDPLFTTVDRVILGLIVGVFGQVGDLTASIIKRETGVKDSGFIFATHGGAYDRFDSMIFISGAAYLFFIGTGFVPHP